MAIGGDTSDFAAGALIGAYRVVKKLGAGQMGDVYLADAPQGGQVAVKRLRFTGQDRAELQRRFAREARLSASLAHPNVVRVLDHGIDQGSPYLVMPVLVGRDLESWLEETGPLSARVAVSIVREAALGLAYAHGRGIVHRDFKPANVMLHEEGDALVPIVCDFGIAKVEDEDGALTASGAVMGTPLYMAPEQFIDCKRVDLRCDVWALGMVLYHALAGRPAYADLRGLGDLLLALREASVPPLQSFAPWVPSSLARVVHAALLPLERRFATVDDLLTALERWGHKPVRLTRESLVPLPAEERSQRSVPAMPVQTASELGEPDDATVADSAPAAEPPDAMIGRTLAGRYRIGVRLGVGGMGAVYDAVDLEAPSDSAHRSVAVKVMLLDGKGSSSDASRRFLREARSAQKVDSPHAARVLDVGVDDETRAHYLVMERLRGKDLAQILATTPALTPEVAVTLFIQACEGLGAAHAMGIVHRDIKPSNLFVHESDGLLVLKVCDFGIAKQLATEGVGAETELTQTGGLLGSPLYMSPEQAKSAKNVDARSDIFSLALSLHEALTGQRPWSGCTSMGEIIVAVVTEDVPPIAAVAPWIEPGLARVVDAALTRDRAARTATIAELASALRPFAKVGPLSWSEVASVDAARRSVVHAVGGHFAGQPSSPFARSVSAVSANTDHALAVTGNPARPRRGVWLGVAAALAIGGGVGGVLWMKGTMNQPVRAAASAPASASFGASSVAPPLGTTSSAVLPVDAGATSAPAASANAPTASAPTARAAAARVDPRAKPSPVTPLTGGARAPAATSTAIPSPPSPMGRGNTAPVPSDL
jgi:serine/threonine-protein kinase